MTVAPPINGSIVPTLEEQCLLGQLRALPGEAVPLVSEYLDLLKAHFANPGAPDHQTPDLVASVFADRGFQDAVRALPPQAAEFVFEVVTFLAGRRLSWSCEDARSLEPSATLMAVDPFMKRINDALSRDFAGGEVDGLEED